MSNLGQAHKGYLYQDLVTAYHYGLSLVERITAVAADYKTHRDDCFDDLHLRNELGRKSRLQFKHSDGEIEFSQSHLNSDSYRLRLDRLVSSWKNDPEAQITDEYRVCVTWKRPTDPADLALFVPSSVSGTFGSYSTTCYRINVDYVWPEDEEPKLSCLSDVARSDFLSFAELFTLELECPSASLELERPGELEVLLFDVLENRIGFGRFPNRHLGPTEAAARLVVNAIRARIMGASGEDSTMSSQVISSRLGLVTDFGRVSQEFPFRPRDYVSRPAFHNRLVESVDQGGIVVLEGSPGAGKSWELTALADTLRERGDVVACHYCYLEPGDREVQKRITLDVFYGNLIAGIIDASPSSFDSSAPRYSAGAEELQSLFDEVELNEAQRLVVIVDGLDHIARVLPDAPTVAFEETEIARDLLALSLPSSVSVVVGSQPGDHIAQLVEEGRSLTVPPWDDDAVRSLLQRTAVDQSVPGLETDGDLRNEFVSDLVERSEGNALYCTYLCREVEYQIVNDIADDPVAVLRELPPSAGDLASYYDYLLGSLDEGSALVAETLGLIEFGITLSELGEVYPILSSQLPELIDRLAPILERSLGRGGMRIYHESFRRHILEGARMNEEPLGPKLRGVIEWLNERGFLRDARAFRYYLPNLVRADREDELFDLITVSFVSDSVAAGHPTPAIEANLALFANAAAKRQDFPKLIRAVELTRSLGTCDENLYDRYEYYTTFGTIFGSTALSERLVFDGSSTMSSDDGVRLCSFCAENGGSPPWHLYLADSSPSESEEELAVSLARLHGRLLAGEDEEMRDRLLDWLRELRSPEDVDPDYAKGVIDRWAEYAGEEDLLDLRREAECEGVLADILDLEFARRTNDEQLRIEAVRRVAQFTDSPSHAIEALLMGAEPSALERFTEELEGIDIGIGGRGIHESGPLERWVVGVRIAAVVNVGLIEAERFRIRGEGWYRLWLEFVIDLANAERLGWSEPEVAAIQVMSGLRRLASDVNPFSGEPRACDLYRARGIIADSLGRALGLLLTEEQWREALDLLKTISDGTTTTISRSPGGPLTQSSLVELVLPFVAEAEFREVIRESIEPLVEQQQVSNLYNVVASDEMSFAKLLSSIGDHSAAVEHWEEACRNLCAYGMRKDMTIFDLLEGVAGLEEAGHSGDFSRFARVLSLVYAVILHTDGSETRHSVSSWFEEFVRSNQAASGWLLSRSIIDHGGSFDYRLERALVHWIDAVEDISPEIRCRLEMIVTASTEESKLSRRLESMETILESDRERGEQELQLLAAAIHGDPITSPEEPYRKVCEFASGYGVKLPAGLPDPVSRNDRDDRASSPSLSSELIDAALDWEIPPSPSELIRRIRIAVDDRTIPDDRLIEYCCSHVLRWAEECPDRIHEFLGVVSRADRFGYRIGFLEKLGSEFESCGSGDLAAHALVLAYTGARGGGGWLTFGGEGHVGLLLRALEASRSFALETLALEVARRRGGWGITRHLVDFFCRAGEAGFAATLWEEAFTVISFRLPGSSSARGPFLSFETSEVPGWSVADAGISLIFSRIAHPEKKRKTVALACAAQMIEQEGEGCVNALRVMLSESSALSYQSYFLKLLWENEQEPYALSRELRTELNFLVGSGKFGIEFLARQLLVRAEQEVTSEGARPTLIYGEPLSEGKERAVLSLDSEDRVQRICQLWPGFGSVVAAWFDTKFNSSDENKARVKERHSASHPDGHRNFPRADFWNWEEELFEEALHEAVYELKDHLWSEGYWDDHITSSLASLLLPDLGLTARHSFSRRVRPSWPLPSNSLDGIGDVKFVPDGEFEGWACIAYSETLLQKGERSYDDLEFRITALSGVVLAEEVAPLSGSEAPFTFPHSCGWTHPFARTEEVEGFGGALASLDIRGGKFEYRDVFGLSPLLLVSLGASPRSELGPLDLFDVEGNLFVAHRWWDIRPLSGDGFASEHPQLKGAMLLLRPDVLDQLREATGLRAFEVCSATRESVASQGVTH